MKQILHVIMKLHYLIRPQNLLIFDVNLLTNVKFNYYVYFAAIDTTSFCSSFHTFFFSFESPTINLSSPLCSDPHVSGEGGTIYSTEFFFVQSILADRYIHCREL